MLPTIYALAGFATSLFASACQSKNFSAEASLPATKVPTQVLEFQIESGKLAIHPMESKPCWGAVNIFEKKFVENRLKSEVKEFLPQERDFIILFKNPFMKEIILGAISFLKSDQDNADLRLELFQVHSFQGLTKHGEYSPYVPNDERMRGSMVLWVEGMSLAEKMNIYESCQQVGQFDG